MRTKIAATLLIALSASVIFASICLASAVQPQPFAIIWITKSSAGPDAYTITYKNFGFKDLAGVEVSVAGPMAVAGGTTPTLVSASTTGGWSTMQVSGQQIDWETSGRAKDYMAFNFYLYNAPCTLQGLLYDKDGNVLRTVAVDIG